MCVLASSSDLITLFLGLELMTMPSYLLTGLHKTDRYSNEGGLKYFLLGSFASAILLFGTAGSTASPARPASPASPHAVAGGMGARCWSRSGS